LFKQIGVGKYSICPPQFVTAINFGYRTVFFWLCLNVTGSDFEGLFLVDCDGKLRLPQMLEADVESQTMWKCRD